MEQRTVTVQVKGSQRLWTTLQTMVLKDVTKRGYRTGWTDPQFAARQVVKGQEELAELAVKFKLPGSGFWSMRDEMAEAGNMARSLFDDPTEWDDCGPINEADTAAIGEEIADVVITMFCLAEVYKIPLVALILKKVRADIRRGVRALLEVK